MDLLVCDQCKKTVYRRNTLVILDKKDDYKEKRVCRDCQMDFYLDELKRKDIKGREAKVVKLWSKDVKDGAK